GDWRFHKNTPPICKKLATSQHKIRALLWLSKTRFRCMRRHFGILGTLRHLWAYAPGSAFGTSCFHGLKTAGEGGGERHLPLPSAHRRQNSTQEFARSGRQAVTFSCSPGGLTGGCAPTRGAERRIKHGISQNA